MYDSFAIYLQRSPALPKSYLDHLHIQLRPSVPVVTQWSSTCSQWSGIRPIPLKDVICMNRRIRIPLLMPIMMARKRLLFVISYALYSHLLLPVFPILILDYKREHKRTHWHVFKLEYGFQGRDHFLHVGSWFRVFTQASVCHLCSYLCTLYRILGFEIWIHDSV